MNWKQAKLKARVAFGQLKPVRLSAVSHLNGAVVLAGHEEPIALTLYDQRDLLNVATLCLKAAQKQREDKA